MSLLKKWPTVGQNDSCQRIESNGLERVSMIIALASFRSDSDDCNEKSPNARKENIYPLFLLMDAFFSGLNDALPKSGC
jgi:hypothetical protein